MASELPPKRDWVSADFNGMLERDLLCVSHEDTATTEDGRSIELKAGMDLTVYDVDMDDDGSRNDIFASGVVEVSPDYAQCRGSRWSLRIDSHGVRHESDIRESQQTATQSRYFELVVRATRPDTEIWLAHQGHFVEKGKGTLRTELMPGRYAVQFGADAATFPIDLTQDTQLTEEEIRRLPPCPRPVVHVPPRNVTS